MGGRGSARKPAAPYAGGALRRSFRRFCALSLDSHPHCYILLTLAWITLSNLILAFAMIRDFKPVSPRYPWRMDRSISYKSEYVKGFFSTHSGRFSVFADIS